MLICSWDQPIYKNKGFVVVVVFFKNTFKPLKTINPPLFSGFLYDIYFILHFLFFHWREFLDKAQ